MSQPALILASKSTVRAELLKAVGLTFNVVVSGVDEDKIKEEFLFNNYEQLAHKLAHEKAKKVSLDYFDALIIGADQILVCENRLFNQPKDLNDAKENLKFLRGKSHCLISAVSLFQNGQEIWHCSKTAHLYMRSFTDDFLTGYLSHEGDNILGSVGCYRLEGLGLQLFEKIDGDYFTILGLPMLDLLSALRTFEVVDE